MLYEDWFDEKQLIIAGIKTSLHFFSICVCVHARMCASSVYGDLKTVLNTLELELLAVVAHLMWVLGTEFESFGEVASAFNC